MPEGPECKLTAEKLNYWLRGQELTSVSLLSGRYLKQYPTGLASFDMPATLINVLNKGKFIYFEFKEETGNRFIWSTLGLTGKWLDYPTEHARVKLSFTGEIKDVYYCDQRNFGTLHFDKSTTETFDKICGLGLDLCGHGCDYHETKDIIAMKRNQNKTMAEILMNQQNFAGVGNYVKAEALYRALISPHRLGKNVSGEECFKLHQAISDVLDGSYYSQKGELTGMDKYDKFKKVIYRRDVAPCGNPIVSETTLDKRTTWWVPKVQR